jgi:peptidoglycan/LPS O-acetylase OafA/YrhL
LENMANAKLSASTAAPNKQSALVEDGRIRGFDGLRAIAFLLVFASHKIYFKQLDSFGDIGLWLFFVLSGFLITRILARSRAEIESGLYTAAKGLGGFYLRRTARIFPPYYLVLAFFTAVSVFVPIAYFGTSEKLAYLLYGTNFLIAARSEWIGDFGHFWSLAIEEQFYLLFAPIVLLVPRRHTMIVCLAVISTGVVTKIALEVGHASAVSIDVNSLVNFALLGFGGVIGLSADRPAPKWFIGGTAQVAVLCFYLALPAVLGMRFHIWMLLGKLSAVAAGILLFQIFQGQQSWFVTVLQIRPIRKIGRISYGAYLIHHFVYFSTIGYLFRHIGVEIAAPRPVQVLAELAISLMLASLSWRYFEQPIVAWAARVTRRRSSTWADSVTPSPIAASSSNSK